MFRLTGHYLLPGLCEWGRGQDVNALNDSLVQVAGEGVHQDSWFLGPTMLPSLVTNTGKGTGVSGATTHECRERPDATCTVVWSCQGSSCYLQEG
jgi:hypothetical protein